MKKYYITLREQHFQSDCHSFANHLVERTSQEQKTTKPSVRQESCRSKQTEARETKNAPMCHQVLDKRRLRNPLSHQEDDYRKNRKRVKKYNRETPPKGGKRKEKGRIEINKTRRSNLEAAACEKEDINQTPD